MKNKTAIKLEDKGLLTRAALAKEFGVTESTIKRWQIEDDMPVVRVGKQRYYDIDDVVRWMKEREG